MPELDAPSITEVDAPAPSLSYDFSKWNGADDTIRDQGEPLPVTFRVYTAQEIQDAPLRRTAPAPLDSGISNVADAIETAKSFGPRGMLARVGLGAAGAILAVGVIAILATLADDTPSRAEAPAIATAAPIPMAAPIVVVTTSAPVAAAAPVDEAQGIELPASPDRPARMRLVPTRARPSLAVSPATTTKHIIRDNPY